VISSGFFYALNAYDQESSSFFPLYLNNFSIISSLLEEKRLREVTILASPTTLFPPSLQQVQ
jgi:hypothetical protein